MWDVIGDIFRPSACGPFWTGVSYDLATTTSADQRHATRATQSRGGARKPCQGPLIKHERALPWAVVPVTDGSPGKNARPHRGMTGRRLDYDGGGVPAGASSPASCIRRAATTLWAFAGRA